MPYGFETLAIHAGQEPDPRTGAVIPPIMRRILETAERTGTLEKTMADLAEYCETQVARKLKLITTLIEPIMIVLIAMSVGGMMLAIIAPIYNIISQVSRR